MSGKRARVTRRLPPKAVRAEVLQVALMPAVCRSDDASLAWARQVTHDGIISETGRSRRTGVRWHTWTGAAALEQWDHYCATSTQARSTDDQAVYRRYLLDAGDAAALVIATVEVAVPRAFAGPS